MAQDAKKMTLLQNLAQAALMTPLVCLGVYSFGGSAIRSGNSVIPWIGFALLIIGFIAGWIVIIRHRQARAERALKKAIWGVALNGVVLAALLSIAIPAYNDYRARALASDRNRDQATRSLQKEAYDLARREIAGEDVTAEREALAEKTIQGVVNNARNPSEEKMARAFHPVLSRVQGLVADATVSGSALVAAGGIDPLSLESKESIIARLALVDQAAQANDALLAYLNTLDRAVRKEMVREGFSESEIVAATHDWKKKGNFDKILQVRDYDRQIYAKCSAVLTLLGDEWGQWSIDAGGEALLFSTDETSAAFNALMEDVVRIEAEKMALFEEMAAASR